MAPAGVMDGLSVDRNDCWALNEVLTRFGFPPASQVLIRLPEFGAGRTGGLGLSRLTATEADWLGPRDEWTWRFSGLGLGHSGTRKLKEKGQGDLHYSFDSQTKS